MDNSILKFDRTHLWHPYTSINEPLPVVEVVSADGVRLELRDGRNLIDGMSSWWSVIHGYKHPKLIQAIQEQTEDLCHVMFGGITHEPAVTLGKKLVDLTPGDLSRIFYCDSGSVAVEVAMKMAMQYFYAQGKKKKKRFLTIRSGYHGDTFHAMAVCDPVTGMHKIYSGVLPSYLFADKPEISFHQQWHRDDIHSFEQLIVANHGEICAVILEPIVQGAGGMRFYHPEYLKEVRELCGKYDVLLIADEIATGFGRSGKMFGCDHANVVPDIMCLGKAITGGYMSFGVTIATSRVGDVVSSGDPNVFMHGPTFMGSPLACRVASASIDLLLQTGWKKKVKNLEQTLHDGLEPCKNYENVAEVRVLGGIGVVEMKKAVDMQRIQQQFIDAGIWVRPFGKLVYLMPPYVISGEDCRILTSALCEVVGNH